MASFGRAWAAAIPTSIMVGVFAWWQWLGRQPEVDLPEAPPVLELMETRDAAPEQAPEHPDPGPRVWPKATQLPPPPTAPSPRTRFRIKVNGKVGFIDAKGTVVIEPRWEDGGPFNEGLAQVKEAGKVGFIDESGAIAIPLRFDQAGAFSTGLVNVRVGEYWGYADRTGRVVIAAVFDSAGVFDVEFTSVTLGERWNILKRADGAAISTDGYDEVNWSGEGLVPVRVDQKWGYVDRTGAFVIAPRFAAAWAFAEGLAPVQVGEKWGYIDRTGKLVIPARFDDARIFDGGIASVWVGKRCGGIDRTGRFLIRPRFADDLSFEGELAAMWLGDRKGTALIDRRGRTVLRTGWSSMSLERDAPIAEVRDGDGKYGYIDLRGRVIWPPSK